MTLALSVCTLEVQLSVHSASWCSDKLSGYLASAGIPVNYYYCSTITALLGCSGVLGQENKHYAIRAS